MSESRKSIFDRSFDEASRQDPLGIYTACLKSGVTIKYLRRSEIWKDKTNSLFVTLHDAVWRAPGVSEGLFVDEIDVRYNEISVIC